MQDQKAIDELKVAIWRKAIGEKKIVNTANYFRQISGDIFKVTGTKLHEDTIRNFFTDKHSPRRETLDVFSNYVLTKNHTNDTKHFIDFQNEIVSRKKRVPVFLIAVLVGIILIFAGIRLFRSYGLPAQKSADFFEQKLDCTSLKCLEKKGWTIENYDSLTWNNQNHTNLVLLTQEGDSWLDDTRYTPQIKNILKHKLPHGDFEVEVTLVDFNPSQRYQQAGFFIFFDENQGVPSVRMTYANANEFNKVQGVYRQGLHSNKDLLEGRNERAIISFVKPEYTRYVDSLTLRLEVNQNEFSFARKINNEEFIYIKSVNLELNKTPTYIGLAAFQGYPTLPPSLPPADIIPAQFSKIVVRPFSLQSRE